MNTTLKSLCKEADIDHTPFRHCLEEVLSIEGDFSDHEADLGGATRYGITEEKAREHGYEGPMEELSSHEAAIIYWTDYWMPMGLQAIHRIAGMRLATELLEFGINASDNGAIAIQAMQRALNKFNRRESDWEDIEVDGIWGPETKGALEQCFKKRGQEGMDNIRKLVNCIQGARYLEITDERPENEWFIYGWVNQRL